MCLSVCVCVCVCLYVPWMAPAHHHRPLHPLHPPLRPLPLHYLHHTHSHCPPAGSGPRPRTRCAARPRRPPQPCRQQSLCSRPQGGWPGRLSLRLWTRLCYLSGRWHGRSRLLAVTESGRLRAQGRGQEIGGQGGHRAQARQGRAQERRAEIVRDWLTRQVDECTAPAQHLQCHWTWGLKGACLLCLCSRLLRSGLASPDVRPRFLTGGPVAVLLSPDVVGCSTGILLMLLMHWHSQWALHSAGHMPWCVRSAESGYAQHCCCSCLSVQWHQARTESSRQGRR